MSDWRAFATEAPDLCAAGERLLVGSDGTAIAYLATASASGQPGIAPVCPIFCADSLYLSAVATTPKVRDLRANGRFSLHAFLGENDEEFQVSGRAHLVEAAPERAAVHSAIPFPSFDREDPIFRLDLERAVWVHWERAGQPDTRPVRRSWTASHP